MTGRPAGVRQPMTQRDLARQLGLDFKTVSRALAGAGDVAAPTVERVRTAATAAGFTLQPIPPRHHHPARPLRRATADSIRADGKRLGRFAWDGADWQPSFAGTHDGYVYQLGFYCLPREGAGDAGAE